MALQIVRESFRENLGQQSKEAEHRIEFIREKGPVHYNALKSEWGVSKGALSSWVRSKVYDGLLVWCDEDGGEFADEAFLKKAKHSGTAYLKINDTYVADDVTGLPTPFELTGDDRWDQGGDLLDVYDLKLDRREVLTTEQAADVVIADVPFEEEVEQDEEKDEPFSFDDCTF
jgi:hypothetical protein